MAAAAALALRFGACVAISTRASRFRNFNVSNRRSIRRGMGARGGSIDMTTAFVQMCSESKKKTLFFILQTDGELETRTLVARYTLSAPLKSFEMRARLGVTIDSSRWVKFDMTTTGRSRELTYCICFDIALQQMMRHINCLRRILHENYVVICYRKISTENQKPPVGVKPRGFWMASLLSRSLQQ